MTFIQMNPCVVFNPKFFHTLSLSVMVFCTAQLVSPVYCNKDNSCLVYLCGKKLVYFTKQCLKWEFCFCQKLPVTRNYNLFTEAKHVSCVTRIQSNFRQLGFENLPAAALWKRWPTVLHKYAPTTGKILLL